MTQGQRGRRRLPSPDPGQRPALRALGYKQFARCADLAPQTLPCLSAHTDPSATLSPSIDFPIAPLYDLPCSGDFSPRRGGLRQLFGMSSSACCGVVFQARPRTGISYRLIRPAVAYLHGCEIVGSTERCPRRGLQRWGKSMSPTPVLRAWRDSRCSVPLGAGALR